MTKNLAVTFVSLFGLIALAQPAHATSLSDSLTVREGGFGVGTSYDGPGYDALAPFMSLSSGSIFQASTLTGSGLGETLQFFLLSEVAHYAGTILPGMENKFGVVDGDGNFMSFLQGTDALGTMAETNLLDGQQLTFALDSPESLFTTVDANNSDKSAHFLAMQIVQDGTITFPQATLFGPSFSFNVLAGDVVFFMEDLLASGNALYGGMNSDFDFNNMVVVVRGQPIPEPSTYLLVALALGFFYWHSRRRNQFA